MFLIVRTLVTSPVKRMASSSSCIFCKIVAKEAPANILFEDDRFVVFPDIRPASKVHLLVITKEHIKDIQSLNADDIPMVKDMEQIGLRISEEQGGDPAKTITGFHWPIHSVGHIHMHIISPQVIPWLVVIFETSPGSLVLDLDCWIGKKD